MARDTLTLAKQFIAIRSDPENRTELNRILTIACSELRGFSKEIFERNGVRSVLFFNSRRRPSRFKVLLNGHLDVIPGKSRHYTPTVVKNRLYGVGAMDMKSNVACLINVFKTLAGRVSYPLGLQLVTDEEIGGFDGTKLQVEKGVRADFVIAGESTNFDIVTKAKGVLLLKIHCKGKTAHGAYPWRGKNALLKMNSFIAMLFKKFPVPNKQQWRSSFNLSRIETTNRSFNKVPDDCIAWLDIRFIPEDKDQILKTIKRMLPNGFRLEIVAHEPALEVAARNKYVQCLQSTSKKFNRKKVRLYGAQGTSDARHFTRVGCAGVEFGPIGGGIGTDREWVSIPSLQIYERILSDFLLSL
jgi:succinyl-diaminopimelate desuccinylase